MHGCPVLMVDLDPQSNATSGMGFNKKEIKDGIYRVIIDGMPVRESIRHTAVERMDILPANPDLIGAEVELASAESREMRLKNAIGAVKNAYDYIFIDSPPSLGLLTLNALTCADSILIPIQCEYYAMEGLAQLMKTIHLLRQNLNKPLELEGVVMTMFDSRVNLSSQIVGEVRKFFGKKAYETVIRRNIRLSEAPSYGKPVLLYDKSSTGAKEYMAFAKEFISRNTQKPR